MKRRLFLNSTKRYLDQVVFLLLFHVLGFTVVYHGYYENLYSAFTSDTKLQFSDMIHCLLNYNLNITVIVIGVSCYLVKGYELLFHSMKKEHLLYYECGISKAGIRKGFIVKSMMFGIAAFLVSTILYRIVCSYTSSQYSVLAIKFAFGYGVLVEAALIIRVRILGK